MPNEDARNGRKLLLLLISLEKNDTNITLIRTEYNRKCSCNEEEKWNVQRFPREEAFMLCVCDVLRRAFDNRECNK